MPYKLDIPGWTTEADLKAIESLAKRVPRHGLVVEIGTFLGRSIWTWCKSVDPSVTVIGVDPLGWLPEAGAHSMFGETYNSSLGAKALFDQYTKDCTNLRMITESSMAWDSRNIQSDLVFVDAQHKLPWVAFDLAFWYARLKPNGTMCGDDYDAPHPDVVSTVNAFAFDLHTEARRLGSKLWAIDFGKT